MKTRFSTTHGLAAALLLSTLAAPASADIISSGGGDYGAVPLYRALSYGTINFGNNGGAINGVDYASNVAPLPLANGNTTISANGATLTGVGASAYSGWYAGRNYASISVTNANAADLYYEVAGQGSATSVQFYTLDAAAAYATFTWHVTGSTSNPSNVQPNCVIDFAGCYPTATGRLDFGATTDPNANWTNLFDDPGNLLDSITRFGTGTFTYNLPIALNTPINLFYWSSAYTQVNPGDVPAGSSFNLTANYFNTVVLESVGLFDATGNAIGDWTLQDMLSDETVFDQTGRVTAITPAPDLPPSTSVPEPGTLALLGLGLAGLGFARRRQER